VHGRRRDAAEPEVLHLGGRGDMNSTTERAETILVVDDHDGSRDATTRTLRMAGFRTVEAATGGEGLKAAEDHIDLVVLDVNLPDLDGFEVCRALRARPETAEVPVIYLSAAFTDFSDRQQGMEVGADSYLTHPADPTALVATVRALLFAREAHARRRAANARFKAIFDSAPTGMAMLDGSLHVMEANDALCAMLGSDRVRTAGQPLQQLVDTEQPALAQMHAGLARNQHWVGVLNLTKDVGIAELEWRISPDHASDQFLATLSHELRNPLGAILGWARILKRTENLPSLIVQGIDAIHRNARVQSHLISDLLDFAGIRFGKMRLEMETFDPSKTVTSAVETVQHQAHNKDIELAVRMDARPLTIAGDPSRLQQIVWNLLTNAIKFTPAGGRITVTTTVEPDAWIVAVADTGAGIDAEFLPKLFDHFSQQDSTKTKSFAGLGIGLSIVRHLVDLHIGTVDVQSAGPDQGATFTVRIPRSEATGNHPVLDTADLHGLHALVVEDGDDTRALIARLLADAGAEVTEAVSAGTATRQIETRQPDILVSDIGMAKTDGYTLLRSLRASGYSAAAMPAVALTAFVGDEDREEALAAGFQTHLGKPVNAPSLLATISRLAQARPKAARC
jgi:PAS domain S-box-containing protein